VALLYSNNEIKAIAVHILQLFVEQNPMSITKLAFDIPSFIVHHHAWKGGVVYYGAVVRDVEDRQTRVLGHVASNVYLRDPLAIPVAPNSLAGTPLARVENEVTSGHKGGGRLSGCPAFEECHPLVMGEPQKEPRGHLGRERSLEYRKGMKTRFKL
jgi:hypothetical protein